MLKSFPWEMDGKWREYDRWPPHDVVNRELVLARSERDKNELVLLANRSIEAMVSKRLRLSTHTIQQIQRHRLEAVHLIR